MSRETRVNVWETRYRLLAERFHELLHRDMDEITDDEIARVFCGVYVLLKRHAIDKRGRCRQCNPGWLLAWRRTGCMVCRVLAVVMEQPFGVIREWLEDQ